MAGASAADAGWVRPAVRLAAAAVLPLLVPLVITGLVWALPGDPAEIICPRELCAGTDELARRWNLDQGAWHFYLNWLGGALDGDWGRSWRVLQGVPVRELLTEAVPNTAALLGAGALPLLAAAGAGASGRVPPRVEGAAAASGFVPAVVFALLCAAVVDLRFGAEAFTDEAVRLRLLLGAGVLVLADGAAASALAGARQLFARERGERYVQTARLRGEGALSNMLPNLAPALAGQLRARLMQLLSATVVVEVVLRIDGVGDLLWAGTLSQDFGVVLAAAGVYAAFSAALLAMQAGVELGVVAAVRRAPVLGHV